MSGRDATIERLEVELMRAHKEYGVAQEEFEVARNRATHYGKPDTWHLVAAEKRAASRERLAAANERLEAARLELGRVQNRRVSPRETPEHKVPRDAEGWELCPDPLAARTPAELVAALRRYRIWAGEASFRDIARRGRPRVAASTLCTALSSDELPRQTVVQALIVGCGGSEDDERRFVTAWRKIRLAAEDAGPVVARPDLRVLHPQAETG